MGGFSFCPHFGNFPGGRAAAHYRGVKPHQAATLSPQLVARRLAGILPDGTKLFSLFSLLSDDELMVTPVTAEAELFRKEPLIDTDDWEPAFDSDEG